MLSYAKVSINQEVIKKDRFCLKCAKNNDLNNVFGTCFPIAGNVIYEWIIKMLWDIGTLVFVG